MNNWPGSPPPPILPKTTLNPRALLGVTMGVTGLLYAVGKKPPDMLLMANVLVGIVDIAVNLEQLFIEKTLLKEDANHAMGRYTKRLPHFRGR